MAMDDVAAAPGEAHDRGVVLLAFGPFAVIEGLGFGDLNEAKAARNMAFFRRWLSRRLGDPYHR